jgi:hypothetical protein
VYTDQAECKPHQIVNAMGREQFMTNASPPHWLFDQKPEMDQAVAAPGSCGDLPWMASAHRTAFTANSVSLAG